MARPALLALATALLAAPIAGHAQTATLPFSATTSNPNPGTTGYTFAFSNPITPGLYSSATLQGSVTVTAGPNGGTASVTPSMFSVNPTYLTAYGAVSGVPSSSLLALGTAPCTLTGALPGQSITCAIAPTTVEFAPIFFDGMQLVLAYDQLTTGSTATWSGSFTLGQASTVPEPATVALLAPALLLVGAVARRRAGRHR